MFSSSGHAEASAVPRLASCQLRQDRVYRRLPHRNIRPCHDAQRQWTIDLGDVRESARVYINNKYVGCAWAVPYILNCKDALNKGKNIIRIEVTNLPANRIAEMDRQGVKWRKMKEINVVDINYKKTTYENWTPVPSGLNSTVKLVEIK